jgi:hypothetical protein
LIAARALDFAFSARIGCKALHAKRIVPNGAKLVQTSSQVISIDMQKRYKDDTSEHI